MTNDGIVIIDGALPRTERERCMRLVDFLRTIDEMAADKFRFAMEDEESPGTGGEWSEVEDEIILAIADAGYVCSIGRMCPGDVVVWKKAELEEPDNYDDDRYVLIDGLPPGWRIDKSSGEMFYSTRWLGDDYEEELRKLEELREDFRRKFPGPEDA